MIFQRNTLFQRRNLRNSVEKAIKFHQPKGGLTLEINTNRNLISTRWVDLLPVNH